MHGDGNGCSRDENKRDFAFLRTHVNGAICNNEFSGNDYLCVYMCDAHFSCAMILSYTAAMSHVS